MGTVPFAAVANDPGAHPEGLGRSPRAVPRTVRRLIVLLSPSAVAYGYLTVLVAGFLPEVGVEPGSVGLILGAMGISLVVGAIPFGILADRRGRKPILLAGLVGLPPVLLLFAATTEVPLLVLGGVLAGLVEGMFLSSWNAAIADLTTPENREAAFSFSFILSNVTMGFGFALPVFFPSIQAATGLDSATVHRAMLVVVAGLSVLSPIGIQRILPGRATSPPPSRERSRLVDMGPLWKFTAMNALIGLGAGFIIPLIPTWLFLKFGVPDTYSGPLLGLASLTIGFAAIGSAPLSRRVGPIRAIVLTQAVATVFMVALAFSPTALVAGGVYLVRATLMNMASPILDAFLMGIIRPDQRGLASAVNSLFWRLPNSASTVVGGVLLATGDYSLPIFLAAGFYAVSVTGMYALFRKVRPTT